MSTQTGTFNQAQSVTITIPTPNMLVNVEAPASYSTVGRPFHIAGWAIDLASPNTVGVSNVQLYAFPWAGGPYVELAVVPVANPRPDVAAAYGSRYLNSGWAVNTGSTLAPGTYTIRVYGLAPNGAWPGGSNYTEIYVTVQ
jgi:hypothetical protein